MDRMARGASRSGLIIAVVLVAGCRSVAPAPLAPAVIAHASPSATIVIKIDVPDTIPICVEPTLPMRLWRPSTDARWCSVTVGDLRALALARSPAN